MGPPLFQVLIPEGKDHRKGGVEHQHPPQAEVVVVVSEGGVDVADGRPAALAEFVVDVVVGDVQHPQLPQAVVEGIEGLLAPDAGGGGRVLEIEVQPRDAAPGVVGDVLHQGVLRLAAHQGFDGVKAVEHRQNRQHHPQQGPQLPGPGAARAEHIPQHRPGHHHGHGRKPPAGQQAHPHAHRQDGGVEGQPQPAQPPAEPDQVEQVEKGHHRRQVQQLPDPAGQLVGQAEAVGVFGPEHRHGGGQGPAAADPPDLGQHHQQHRPQHQQDPCRNPQRDGGRLALPGFHPHPLEASPGPGVDSHRQG